MGFGKVKTITDAELAALSLSGTNMTYRPGTRLVKITTDPKVYAVEPGGSLRWVKDEATAKALYGDTWNKQIDDVPDVFFTNYSKGADVDSAKPSVGSLVKSASSADIYYVDADGGKRKLADLATFDANGFQSKFVRTVADEVLTGLTASAKGDLKAKEDAVALPTLAAPTAAKPGETPAAPAGKQMLTIALASDNPIGAVHASGTSYNKALSLNLTAGADADVTVTSLTLTRAGLATDTSLSGVAVFANKANERHGTFSTFSSNKATVSMSNEPIKIAKGTTVPVWVKTNITSLAAGQSGTYTLAISAATDISTSGAEISGTFPFTSSTFSLTSGANVVGTLTVDAITVHNNGATDATAVNINMGTADQNTASFRFVAGANEDMKLVNIRLYNNGNTVDDDLKNIDLVGPDSAILATIAKQKDKYITFDLSTMSGGGYTIPKGASRDLTVREDVVSGSARTIRWLIQNDYDVEAYGISSGSGILATLVGGATPTGNDQTFPVGDRVGANFVNKITVAGGTMTLSKASTSPSGNLPAGGTLVQLAKYEVKASGEDMELRQIQYMITRTPAVAANNLTGTFTVKLQESGATTSPTTIFTVAGSAATYAATTTATLTTYPTLTSNKTYYITYEGDIGSAVASGVTYSTQLDVLQVYRKNSNDLVDPSVNLTAANTLTVNTGTMTVALNSSFPPPTVVVNQSTLATIASWTLTAGPAEPILLNSLTASTTAPGFGTYFKEIELWIGGAKKSQDTSSTIAPGTTGTVTFNMSPSYEVPAGQTVVAEVKAKTIASGITANATDRLHITSGGLSGSGKTSLTALSSVPATAIAAQLITIVPSGTYTVSRDTVTNVRSSQIVAGTTGVTFGAYKFQSSNSEAIKKLYLANAGNNSNGITNIGVYDGGTTPIGSITKSSLGSDRNLTGGDEKNVVLDFTGMSGGGYVIPKNTYKVLTVKADTVYAATSGQTAQLVIADLEAEGEGSGVTIFATLQADTTPATAGQAYAVGDVVSLYDNSSVSAELDQDDIGADVDNTYVVTTAAASGAVLNAAADTLFDTNASSTLASTDRLSKWRTLSTETVNAGVTAQNNYALGDVVAIADISAGTHSLYVVTMAVSAGADISAANALVNGLTLVVNDIISRVPAGATETLSASATLTYKAGDVIVVNDTGDADDGIYVVNAAVNPGTSIVAASALVGGTGGLTFAAGQVTKLPITTTELASTSSTYAYRAGDIIVIHDESATTDDGLFVVDTAHAIGTDTTAASGLVTGLTLTTSDRISKLAVMQTSDNVKRLYPTKLNFVWTAASGGAVLSTGGQVEVGRFTMGADTANSANPDAAVSVTGLNFSMVSSATLTNATLHDFSNNANVTSATNITPDRAGGILNFSGVSIGFNHGESRTFRILADVGTSAGSQSTYFRFNAGSNVSSGTATWSVTATGQTAVTGITWTALAGDGADTSSAQMTASSVASDAIAPTISSILMTQAGGADNAWAAADTIAITFSKKIDPASVHTDLRYGAGTASTTSTGTGSLSVGENSGGTNACSVASANDTINITNIACISTGDADTMNMSGSSTAAARQSTTMGLSTAGTVLTVTLPAFNFQTDDGAEADGGELLTAVRDAAGNLLAASTWSITALDL